MAFNAVHRAYLGAASDEIDATFNALRAAWPKGQVTGTALAGPVQRLTPLARDIAAFQVGQRFSVVYSVLGGSQYEITQKDRDAADRILYESQRLPQYGNQIVDAKNLNDIKAAFMQVALTGSYLKGVSTLQAVLNELKLVGSATAQAVVEAPARIMKVAAGGFSPFAPSPGDGDKPLICGTPLGTFKWSCWDTSTKVIVGVLGAAVVGFIGWTLVSVVRTGLPVAAKVAERRFAGVPSRRKRHRRG